MNPLPGARWTDDRIEGPILRNADMIWPPDYDVAVLTRDVHAYCKLLTRAGNRLPKSFLVNFDWNSYGSKAALTCLHPTPSRLFASFTRRQLPKTRKKTREVDGTTRDVDVPNDEYTYHLDTMTSSSYVAES